MSEKETTAKQINEVVDHVFDKAKEVSGDLQPLAETIITEYIKINIVYSLGCLLGLILSIIILITTIIIARKIIKSTKDEDIIFPTAVLSGVIIIAFTITSVVCIVNAIDYYAHSIAPHYHILKDLIGK